MTVDEQNLIWIDLEMTGLDPQQDVIIEVATIVTDRHLNILAQGPVIAIYQGNEILSAMDEWNTRHHGDSGLTERVRQSQSSTADAERETIRFLEQYVPKGASPMCGNSICQDRRFIARLMPDLEAFFQKVLFKFMGGTGAAQESPGNRKSQRPGGQGSGQPGIPVRCRPDYP